MWIYKYSETGMGKQAEQIEAESIFIEKSWNLMFYWKFKTFERKNILKAIESRFIKMFT